LLLYVLSAEWFIKAQTISNDVTVLKKTPYKYKFTINNQSILPYPFIDVYLRLPQVNNVRTNIRKAYLSLLPKNTYCFNNTVQFRFRGTYDMGIDYIYVYDFLRLFRLKIRIDKTINIYVIPRKLILDENGNGAISDSETVLKKSLISFDKLDVSDVRNYRAGDSLKSIHWKLSSKSEDFIVRDYDTGSSKETYIYIDLSSQYPHSPAVLSDSKKRNKASSTKNNAIEQEDIFFENDDAFKPLDNTFYEDMNEYCADGVIELTIAAILRELKNGNKCSLFWYDSRSKNGIYAYTLSTTDDFMTIYNLFSTAPLTSKEYNLNKLCSKVNSSQSTKQIYITSAIDKKSVKELCNCAKAADNLNVNTPEVILYNPAEKYKQAKARSAYIQNCRKQFSQYGINLIIGNLTLPTINF